MRDDFSLTLEQQRLVEENLDLPDRLLSSCVHPNEVICGLGRDDLYQEGCVALCRAAASYVPGKARFRTYAWAVIRNHLYDYCRGVQADWKQHPTVSLDALSGAGPPVQNCIDHLDNLLPELDTSALIVHFKRKYTGSARLGVEALEWKVRGYTGEDIARIYQVDSNYVRACISRSAKKLRRESAVREFYIAYLGKEPQSA